MCLYLVVDLLNMWVVNGCGVINGGYVFFEFFVMFVVGLLFY